MKQKPLEGCVVLDMTNFVAGPFGAMILGDLGADVLKLEVPPRGDPNRNREDDTGYSPGFAAVNRNKRSVLVDTRTEHGLRILRELIRKADVLITSIRISSQIRLGIDFESTQAINPRLIHASISGIGEVGESRDVPGFDTTAQAQSGLLDLLGTVCDQPVVSKVFFADQLAGLYAALGILAALEHRHASGKGSQVKTSLLRAAAAFTISSLSQTLNAPDYSEDSAVSRSPRTAGFLAYAADGKGIALHIPPAPLSIWEKFIKAFDDPTIADDPRYANKELRSENYLMLHQDIARSMKRRNREEWLAIFQAADVPVAPYNGIQDLPRDEAVNRDGIVVSYPGIDGHLARSAGPGVLVDDSGRSEFDRAPLLGEHTAEVLAELGIVPDPTARDVKV